MNKYPRSVIINSSSMKGFFKILTLVALNTGIVGLVNSCFGLLSQDLYVNNLSLNSYTYLFYFPNKEVQLSQFIITGIALFLLSIFFIFKYRSITKANFKLLIVIIIINVFLVKRVATSYCELTLDLLLWFSMLFITSWPNLNRSLKPVKPIFKNVIKGKALAVLCLILVVLHLGIVFIIPNFSKAKIMNEFLELPERTLLTSGGTGERYVDNYTFIEDNFLLGFQKRYRVEEGSKNPIPKPGTYLEVSYKDVANFLEDGETSYAKKMYFDHDYNALVSVASLTGSERIALKQHLPNSSDTDNLIRSLVENQGSMEALPRTQEQIEFLEKNKLELSWQFYDRGFFHHHNHIMAAVSQMALERDTKEIYMQYGWLNAYILKNIMQVFGGISYHLYVQILNWAYIIYFILCLGLVYILYRQIEVVAIVALLIGFGINSLGYYYLQLAPGYNPIRHFIDIFIIYLFWRHLTTNRKMFYLALLCFSMVAVLNDKVFGLFISISYLLGLVAKEWIASKKLSVQMAGKVIIGLACLCFGLFVSSALTGKDPISYYFLKGFIGWPFNKLVNLLLIISVGYSLLVYRLYKSKFTSPLSVLLFTYSHQTLLYYVWTGNSDHLFSMITIHTLGWLTLVIPLEDNCSTGLKKSMCEAFLSKKLIVSYLFFSLIVFLNTGNEFYKNKHNLDRIFETHKTYNWSFTNANIISTINPTYFDESVKLINKFSNNNAIYMISKYDRVLPFLSNRYNALPFIDLSHYLLSEKEIKQAIATIKREQPNYLFVDTSIKREYKADIINPAYHTRAPELYSNLYEESVSRSLRLNLLKRVFDEISEDYDAIEQGTLITVYKRRY